MPGSCGGGERPEAETRSRGRASETPGQFLMDSSPPVVFLTALHPAPWWLPLVLALAGCGMASE